MCGRKAEFTVNNVWATKWPDAFECMAIKMQGTS